MTRQCSALSPAWQPWTEDLTRLRSKCIACVLACQQSMESSSTGSGRKTAYKKSGSDIAAVRERRRLESSSAARQNREGQLQAKRLKREHTEGVSIQISGLDKAALTEELEELKISLKGAFDSKGHLQALTRLRQLTSAAGDAAASDDDRHKADHVLEVIAESGVISNLIADLFPRQDSDNNRRACLEACWTLSNLAAAEHRFAQQVLNAAPVLIAHLSGGFGTAVAEQSAWTLGNLAGDCKEFRDRLFANGALLPMTRLMLSGKFWSESAAVIMAAQTAAWALCNLIKDTGPEVKEMVSFEGFVPGLRELLKRADAPGLVTEVAWMTAYATASQPQHLKPGHLLQPLLALLPAAVEKMQKGERGLAPAVLTPVLRSIGNLVASGSPEELLPDLASDAVHLQCLLTCAQCRHRGIQKESLWVLSNFVALQPSNGRSAVSLLKALNGDQILANLLREAPFPVRKEAAYGVANLCWNDPSNMADMAGRTAAEAPSGVLPAFSSLARCPDPEAALLGLQFFKAVLHLVHDHGQQMVESVDGIDILEQHQLEGSPESQKLATELLDAYFGIEYGL